MIVNNSNTDDKNLERYKNALALFIQERLNLNYIPEVGDEKWYPAESYYDNDPESYGSFDYDNPGYYKINYRRPGNKRWDYLQITPEEYSFRDLVMSIGKYM